MTVYNLSKFRFNDELLSDIEDAIYKYEGKLCIAEVIGVLEIIKLRILEDFDND